MNKKSGSGGTRKKMPGKKTQANGQRISDYAAAQISDGAVIDFVFHEDFDGDGLKEAVVGFTRFTPFPPDSAVLLIHGKEGGMEHTWLSPAREAADVQVSGTFDNAVAADTDGDGRPELIISHAYGHEHEISVCLYDWNQNREVHQAWHSERVFFHGSMEVQDTDEDGIEEIIIESGTHAGNEMIEMKESCYHVRNGFIYKWNGTDYQEREYTVRMPYESYNTAVDFLRAIWLKDYQKAYDMVVMPGFLGLAGLDDASLEAFRSHVVRKVRPVLVRNLATAKLIPSEPYDTYCQFSGAEDCFTVELVRVKDGMKVYSLDITKRGFGV